MSAPEIRHPLLLIAGVGVAAIALAVLVVLLAARAERERDFGDVQAVVEAGIAQFRAEQYELSVKTLSGIPVHVVADWRIPYYMGSAHVQLKDYRKGADLLEQALELNPKEENILFALGVAYYKLGNLSLSKAYFAAVLDIDPGHEEAKGLMDIMAGLERYQTERHSEQAAAESSADGVDP